MRFPCESYRLVVPWLVIATCLALVAGCADAPPTPEPIPAAPTASKSALVALATNTMTPIPATPTRSPTRAASPAPSSTPSPSPSPSPTDRRRATPTVAASPTSTVAASPSPTAGPAVAADGALDQVRQDQADGDYQAAIAGLLALLDRQLPPDQSRDVRYLLAETYLLDQDYAAAAAAWEGFLADYPEDERYGEAAFMAARAYQAGNECEQALELYEVALADAGTALLADLIHENMGDCYSVVAADVPLPRTWWDKGIAAYREALAASKDVSVQVSLRERIAGIHLAAGDPAAAVAEYDAILAVAKIESYRAKIEYLAGQALATAGQTEAAWARYLQAVNRYPNTEYAYLSLIELVDGGAQVDEFQRGLVDYYAGADYPDAYGAAIRAFDRYLAAGPGDKAAEALYRKALAQRATEQPQAALETLEALIAGYALSTWLPSAWLEKGATLALLDENDAAVKAYRDTAAFFPAAEAAPQALWRAARLRASEGSFAEAAALYEELQATFPAFDDAAQALWQAALVHYRSGKRQPAVVDLQTLLDKYPGSDYESKALFWLGKLAPGSGGPQGGEYWDRLVKRNPREYYALRVAQVRSGAPLTATRLITSAVESPAWHAEAAEAEILTWLQSWTGVPTGTQLSTLPASLQRRADLRRAEALLAVALRPQALSSFDQVRAASWDTPVALAQLAFYFQEKGFYGLAARCSARLAGLSPGKTVHQAPLAVQRLAYPLPYARLLAAEAQERELDPLLLAALIRQESLFEKEAVSYVGARGLGQVMPATGEGIARSLEIADFDLDDLFRPAISIRFAAYYLAVQMNRFDDNILVALAAYNGGPGNTLYWLEGIGDDLDLFVEVITASQSRIYLQRVYEQYLIYERLYR